jgi:hypothetical protein
VARERGDFSPNPQMQADFAIELGSDDEALEFPWEDPERRVQYFDLKRQPELLSQVPEASQNPELRAFLIALNSSDGTFETAKCDAWATTEMSVEEEIFGAAWKFASYIDVLFSHPGQRSSFSIHERWVRAITEMLKRVPDIPAMAELCVRRCYALRTAADAPEGNDRSVDGFYVTAYVSGYGTDEPQARKQWGIGLRLLENALRQWSLRESAQWLGGSGAR